MAKRTLTYTICDGCSRSDLFDDVEIVSSARKRPYLDNDYGTLDICHICADQEKYACRLCESVHSDENPCEFQQKGIEQWQSV